MNEQWRPIKLTNGVYEVSDLGRIRHTKTRRVKTQFTNVQNGYVFCTAKSRRRPNKNINLLVHKCVAETFNKKPSRTGSYLVMHMDGDKSNNTSSNLKWGTRSENVLASYENGSRIGRKSSVLTDDQYHAIDDSWADGRTQTQIAAQFGISNSTVSRIVMRDCKRARRLLGPPRRMSGFIERTWSARDFTSASR